MSKFDKELTPQLRLMEVVEDATSMSKQEMLQKHKLTPLRAGIVGDETIMEDEEEVPVIH